MIRYSEIKTKLPREFLLLQGTGCRWRKCTFCSYYTDVSNDPFSINRKVISRVSGRYGVLDIINSGSAPELDERTLAQLRKTVEDKNIKTLWFESHYMYRHRLSDFAALFPSCEVKFRCGAETFNGELRESWKKGIPKEVTAADIAQYFKGVCLLIGVEGQTFETVNGINEMVEEVNGAVENMTDCITRIMDFLENTVVLDYNSFRQIGEEYQADANTFAEAMSRINQEIADLDSKICDIAESIENVSDTVSQSAEGVNQIAEKSTEAASKTAEGYELLNESKESMGRLRKIIEKFQI